MKAVRRLWQFAGTLTVALCFPLSLPAQEWHVFTTENSGLPDNNVLSLALDKQGVLWIGTKFEGMASFDGKHWNHYKPPPGSRKVSSHDLQNRKLFGPQHLLQVSPLDELTAAGPQAEAFYDLTIDSHGVKWVGTKIAGIKRFDGSTWTSYDSHNSPLPNDYAWSVLADPQDRIWIGTKYGGLAVLDANRWTIYDTTNSPLPSNDVTCLTLDPAGRSWIGTTKGIAVFDGQTWTLYTPGNSALPIGHVETIVFDPAGIAWIGTWGAGLVRYDGKRWEVFDQANSGLPDNYIWSLAVDTDGRKWIGTFTNGLAVFDNFSWQVFSPHNSPLPHEMVYDIVIDRHGNQWLATLLGLAVYRRGGVLLEPPPENPSQPTTFRLESARPNPFVESTVVGLLLGQTADVSVEIYDVLGRPVRRLASHSFLPAGHYTFLWDGHDGSGAPAPAGVYVCIVRVGPSRKAMRLVKVK